MHKRYRYNYAIKVFEVPHRFPKTDAERAANRAPTLLEDFRTSVVRSDSIDGLRSEAATMIQKTGREIRSVNVGAREIVAYVQTPENSKKDPRVRSQRTRS